MLELQSFVEQYHPNKAVASRVCNMFNDIALSHYRQILKRRQKQTSLDRFFMQQGSNDSQAGPSASKRQRREVTPDRALIPEVLMEGDSPSKQYPLLRPLPSSPSSVCQQESSIKVKVMLNVYLSISLVIYIYFSLFSVFKTIVILYKMYFLLIFLGVWNGLIGFTLFLMGNIASVFVRLFQTD